MLTLRGLAQQPVARMEQSGTREPEQLVSQSKMMKNDDPGFRCAPSRLLAVLVGNKKGAL